MPFVLAAAVTVLIGTAVALEPYFAGDVRLTRLVQAASPAPQWWATPVSNLAPAPRKYYVMAVVLTASFFVAGWRGLALIVAFLLLEQYGAEYTKAIFKRPRPSRDLITVIGNPSGFSFPSTTLTFFAVTFGGLGILALVLGLKELLVETGETLDDGVLAAVERENLVRLGVVDEALLVVADVGLQLGHALLEEVSGGGVRLGLLL
jgi:membrane-associated phospholipid phosphatase